MASSIGTPRTLTEMLRTQSDIALVDLLRQRPDLAFPPPRGFSDLASRATTRHSVSCALDSLNAFELHVANGVSRFADAFSAAELSVAVLAAGLSGAAAAPNSAGVEAAVERAVARLRALALVWGDDAALRPVRALATVVSAGTGPDAGSAGAAPTVGPPDFPTAPQQSTSLVDKVAAGSAFEFVRRMDVLLKHCAVRPVRLRRDGDVGARDSRDIARLLDVPAASASLYLGLAEAAGLLGIGSAQAVDVLLPTVDFEPWRERTLAEQWAVLAKAWREGHVASGPAWLKEMCLTAFGDPSEGRVLPAEAVAAWVTWQRPRSTTAIRRLTATVLQQATEIGLLGMGAVASFAASVDVPALDAHLPARTGEVVLQADLTAVASGPLTAAAAQELGALADIESRGGATVYRFSPETLRRGAEQGWEAERILALLTQRSRTPVPQPLVYLIRDLERHGRPPGSARGRPGTEPSSASRRAVALRVEREQARPPHLDVALAQEMVATLRAAELEATSSAVSREALAEALPKPSPATSRDLATTSPVDTLREAVETGEAVWISSVDTHGRAVERVVTARSADVGELISVDVRSGEAVAVPMSRVTAAHILRGSRKAY